MNHISKITILAVLLLCISAPFSITAQQNPFITTTETDKSGAELKQTPEPSAPLSGGLFIQKTRALQKKMQASISEYIADYKSEKDPRILFKFLLFSYIYGLIHVIGPGHRKIFLFSYFISSKEKWKKGMLAGFMTAVLHAMSAVALIGGLYLVTSKALLTRFNDLTPLIERVSYGILVALGLFLLVSNIIQLIRGETHKPGKASPGTILFVLASGLIPCPGAAALMIFSIAVQAPLVGVYSVIAMSLGMATVLTLIPPAAILLQDRLEPLISRWNPGTGERIHAGLAVAGAAVMICFGLFFMI